MDVPAGLPEALGFRIGARGTHTSRTIMLAELSTLLQAVGAEATKAGYWSAIRDDNVLGKKTTATRKLSAQRLSELYGLDPSIPLFRTLRTLWADDQEGRPMLALLCAAARDPLLRMTARPVLDAREGDVIGKAELEAGIEEAAPGRFNKPVLNKIARNAASSWTQSGHLQGHAVKVRAHPAITPAVTAYALYLGYVSGFGGKALLTTFWARLLDLNPELILQMARDAAWRGWIDVLRSGDVVEVRFPGLISAADEEVIHELH